jgi:hypothetical protein
MLNAFVQATEDMPCCNACCAETAISRHTGNPSNRRMPAGAPRRRPQALRAAPRPELQPQVSEVLLGALLLRQVATRQQPAKAGRAKILADAQVEHVEHVRHQRVEAEAVDLVVGRDLGGRLPHIDGVRAQGRPPEPGMHGGERGEQLPGA